MTTPADFVAALGAARALAILRTPMASAAVPAMEAAIRGGFRIVEFTLNTPGALEHIATVRARHPDVLVGAGTVLTVVEARAAVAAGAVFLVSPVVDEAVLDEAARLGVAMMPGTHTPTEMLRAHRGGAALQKLFPAPASGAAYVRAILGPMPFLKIVPTSGVDGDNARAWLDAGAHAVGFVAPLFDAAAVIGGHTDRIEARARSLLGTCYSETSR